MTSPSLRERAQLRSLAAWGAGHAPRWFVALAPPVIGALFFVFLGRLRRVVTANQQRIDPAAHPLRQLWRTLATFLHFARNLTRQLAPARHQLGSGQLRVRGGAQLQRTLRKGGAVVVTAHVGPWDEAAAAMRSLLDARVLMLMGEEKDAQAGAIQDRRRSEQNIDVIRTGGGVLDGLPAVMHLLNGGVLLCQLDRAIDGQGTISTSLLGQPYRVPRGIFQLAAVARVPVIVVLSARLTGPRLFIDVGAPISLDRRPSEEQLQLVAGACMERLGRHLAAFPDQWFHFVGEQSHQAGS